MRFLTPNALYFLVLAAIPVVLYLLFRRRKNEVSWGATYVLRQVIASRRSRTLWKQIVIITLRTLMLAVLVAVFARPFLAHSTSAAGASNSSFPHGMGTLHRVIVLDNSLSMNARHGTVSRMDAARQVVAGLLAGTRPGDACHVITLCPPKPRAPVAAAAVTCPLRADAALERATEITTISTPPDFPGALRAAVETFRDNAAASRQLVLITDLARCDHPSIADYEIFGTLLSELQVKVVTLGLYSHDAVNLAIEEVTAGTELLLAGQPTNVSVRVMNYSEPGNAATEGAQDAHLQFLVDGVVQAESPCVLSGGTRKTFVFPVTLAAGAHRLEARLNDDAYAPDNRVERFVRAEKALRVLLVVPDEEKGEGFEREGAFLQRALAATSAVTASDTPAPLARFEFTVETVKRSSLAPHTFDNHDVAVFCGISNLPADQSGAMASFVRRGGGILLSAGPGINAVEFNQTFGKLLPPGPGNEAALAAPFRTDFNEEKYLSIRPTEIAAPLLREFEGAENGDLSLARIYNHFCFRTASESPNERTRAPESGPRKSEILLSLSNGDPLLISGTFGKGRVFLWTSSLGGAWNSLPVHQPFVPFVCRLLNLAGGFHAPPRNVKPGEPLILDASGTSGNTGAAGSLFVTTPDARLIETSRVAVGSRSFVRFEQTAAPGNYEFQDSSSRSLGSFSVAMPLSESDLRPLENDEMKSFRAALKTPIASNADELKVALRGEGEGDEQAGWFIVAVLAMFLLDALLTRIWFA